MSIQPFQINIDQSVLDDLQERLLRTHWADAIPGWDHGTDQNYMQELCAYWLKEFDWRKQEKSLNSFNQFRADVDGFGIHFVHEKGKHDHSIPLLLSHGWPDSFLRFTKIIPMLTDPEAYGGEADDSFDVVIPSLPGYGFSDKPSRDGMTFHVADLFHKLMTQELGYDRFAAHGGDWGGMVTEHLARSYSGSLLGIHMTDVPFYHMFQKPSDTTATEEKYLKKMEEFQKKDGAYAMIQGTRPQTLAQGLNDSPTGLAAWVVDKFRSWSDCSGDVEQRFTKDELLTNIMIYWVTGTINSSFLTYYDLMNAGAMRWIGEKVKEWIGSSAVQAGFAIFPRELVVPPREWAERFFNVQRWSLMPTGGHFGAMEEPALLVQDIREYFRPLRTLARKAA